MPDSLGTITVPEITPTGTWPLEVRYGAVRQLAGKVVIHTFGSANEKVEQRYRIGNGERSFQLQYTRLTKASIDSALQFWRDRNGAVETFTLSYPLEEGGTATPTVRFAEDAVSVSRNAQGGGSLSVTLIEVPTSFPTYTVAATLDRFPNGTLATALLAQAQEIIPLVYIRPKLGPGQTYSDNIYLSDRRCTVASQLYQARLLEWSGISQAIGGENDTARFVFGNADGVMELLAADVDLSDASIEFALYHVGTQIRLNLWKGEISEFDPDESGRTFTVSATDVAGALNEFCPQRVVDRSCWKNFKDGVNCTYAGAETSCDKSWARCTALANTDQFGGVFVQPQGVNIKDNSSGTFGIGRRSFTATSIVNDSIYGKPLQHVYTDATLPVPLLVASGREEGDFYAGLGIVGEGPISAYDSDGLKHRFDGQPPHGPLPLGLRRSLGHDPVQDNDPDPNSQYFSLGQGTPQTYDVYKAAGVAFIDIRRTDAKGQQLSRVQDHAGTASVSGGLGGWYWPDASTRAWAAPMTSPVWIAVNEWLRTKQLFNASQAAQEASFNVAEAIAAAAVASDVVPVVIGSGTETQYRFRGTLSEQKPLKDQLQEILNNCLGYYYVANGKLRVGLRYNASAVEAFTAGNVLADSVRLRRSTNRAKFNQLSVQFADEEFNYQTNTVTSQNEDQRKRYGKRQAQSMNLLGTFTKSQAARIAETRLREALGGITADEWKKQRSVSFRTTILALSVEPGMVCSLTHAKAPGGAINFRVKRVVWNGDWSVDVEGDYVCASMYDLTVGPKPADVGVTPAPLEAVEAVPGDIQPISGDAFQFVVSDVADSNGIKRKSIACTYNPPASLAIFAGVSAWLQTPGGVYPLGDADYNGDGSNSTPGRYGSAIFVAPPPAATESWKLYLVSRSRAYRKPLALSTATTPSPYVTMSVDPVDAIGTGTPAEEVATVAASVFYNGDRWGINLTVTFGASRANIALGEIIVRGPTNVGTSVDRRGWGFLPPAAGDYSATLGGEWLRAGSAHNFVVLVETYNAQGAPSTPVSSSTITVNPVNNTTQATSTSVAVWYDTTADGVGVYGFTLGFTQANEGDTSHTEVWIEAFDAATSAYRREQLYTQTGPGGGDNGFAITGRGSLIDATPTAAQNFRVTFYTITKAGNRKSSPPQTVVSVSPQAGALKLNRADTGTIGDALTISGGKLAVADAGITTSKLGALAVTAAKLASGSVDTSKIQALAVTANELATSSVTATKIANAAVGSAAIANLAVGNAAIADGAINNAKIQDATIQSAKIANLDAAKINAGTISVGSGGMSFSGTGGIAVTGNGSITVATGGVVANNIFALASSYGWSMIGGATPSLDYTALFSGGYVNAPSLRVGGTQIVDPSRNASFVNLTHSGQWRPPSISASGWSPTSVFDRIPVYNSFGFLLGYVRIWS
jgi:hypothetical protein